MQITDEVFEVAWNAFGKETSLRQGLRAALAAALAVPEAASLDERMKAAGMIPLSDLLAGNTPLEKWMAHTGVRDLDSFEQWLTMRHREFLTMKAGYELGDKDKTDELYEWVLSHAGAIGEVAANFRAMKERSARSPAGTEPVAVKVKAPYHFHRFVNGEERAEDVEIHHATSLVDAYRQARRLYGNPSGMDLLAEVASPPAPAVVVKALEWRPVADGRYSCGFRPNAYHAENYFLAMHPDGKWGLDDGRFTFLCRAFPTGEAAKAAAQADYETRIRSALVDAPAAPRALPDGWVAVPREPMPEMLGAWYRVKNGHHFHDEPAPTNRSDYAAYRAMIAAAPTIPSSAEEA